MTDDDRKLVEKWKLARRLSLIIVFCAANIFFVSPMQVRLLLLSGKMTIDDVKRQLSRYEITKVCNIENDSEGMDEIERIYGKIKVINEDTQIGQVFRVSKSVSSFLWRPEKCFVFFDRNGLIVGYHYELED